LVSRTHSGDELPFVKQWESLGQFS